MAPKGNQSAKKLKTQEIKDKVYKSYCDHLAEGFSKQSWCYDEDGLTLTQETMETYLKNDGDFDTSKIKVALSKGCKLFEKIGHEMMLGKVEKCQPVIYQIIGRNRWGYDKNDETKETSKSAINVYVDRMKGED